MGTTGQGCGKWPLLGYNKKGLTPKTNTPHLKGEIPKSITEVVGETLSDPTTLLLGDLVLSCPKDLELKG